ncbi:hypothetical protein BB561_004959 [Smittium simulii]|uniref:Uncharacterized protein n=1 Tax=Smittium simulii TaxID=133385 RepID=A0A2T9YD66_9FUNG|nr:hypothetical protein BB561_004959 [Smittium simulii]
MSTDQTQKNILQQLSSGDENSKILTDDASFLSYSIFSHEEYGNQEILSYEPVPLNEVKNTAFQNNRFDRQKVAPLRDSSAERAGFNHDKKSVSHITQPPSPNMYSYSNRKNAYIPLFTSAGLSKNNTKILNTEKQTAPGSSNIEPQYSILPLIDLEKSYKSYFKSKKLKKNKGSQKKKKKNLPSGNIMSATSSRVDSNPYNLDEKSLLSLFNDNEDCPRDFDTTIRRRYFAVKNMKNSYKTLFKKNNHVKYKLDKSSFYNKNGQFNYQDFYTSLLILYLYNNAQHKIDYTYQKNENFHIHRVLFEIARIADASTPYQLFIVWLYNLAKWKNPAESFTWFIIYFLSVYYHKTPALVFLVFLYLIIYHRVRPTLAAKKFCFEDPSKAYIKGPIVKKAAQSVLGKTVAASYFYDFLYSNTSTDLRLALFDIANLLEMTKNCVTWKNNSASRFTIVVLSIFAIICILLPPLLLYQIILYLFGIEFFILIPLQFYYAQYRRFFNVPEYFLWGSSTDLELSVYIYNTELSKNGHHFSVYQDLDIYMFSRVLGISEKQLIAIKNNSPELPNNTCNYDQNSNISIKRISNDISSTDGISIAQSDNIKSKTKIISSLPSAFKNKITSAISSNKKKLKDYKKSKLRQTELEESADSNSLNLKNIGLADIVNKDQTQKPKKFILKKNKVYNSIRKHSQANFNHKSRMSLFENKCIIDTDRFASLTSNFLRKNAYDFYNGDYISDSNSEKNSLHGYESLPETDSKIIDLDYVFESLESPPNNIVTDSYPWHKRASFSSFNSNLLKNSIEQCRKQAIFLTRSSSDSESKIEFDRTFSAETENLEYQKSKLNYTAKNFSTYKDYIDNTKKSNTFDNITDAGTINSYY